VVTEIPVCLAHPECLPGLPAQRAICFAYADLFIFICLFMPHFVYFDYCKMWYL